jgi:trk system potassium uptake protein TrkA
MACQIARLVFNVPKVITRIYDPIREQTYRSLGLETICPTIIGSERIREALLAPKIAQESGERGG